MAVAVLLHVHEVETGLLTLQFVQESLHHTCLEPVETYIVFGLEALALNALLTLGQAAWLVLAEGV